MLEVDFYHRDLVLDSNEPDILLLNGPCSESGLCKNMSLHILYLLRLLICYKVMQSLGYISLENRSHLWVMIGRI